MMNVFEWLESENVFYDPNAIEERVLSDCAFGEITFTRKWIGCSRYVLSILNIDKLKEYIFVGYSQEEVVRKFMRYMGAA